MRRLVEHLNEHTANGLALGFGVGLAGQGLKELVTGAHAADVEAHVVVVLEDLFEFVLPEQSVVDEDAVQPVADGPVQQLCCHR